MNPLTVSLALTAGVSNGLAQSQSLGAAGDLTLNGSLVTGGVGELSPARRVLITSVADDSGLTWTVTGTDRGGFALTENLAGGNAVGVYTVNDFLTVASIHGSGATAGNVTAGTNGVGSTQWFVSEWMTAGSIGAFVSFSGTATASVELTADDPNVGLDQSPFTTSVAPASNNPPVAFSHPLFNGITGNTSGIIDTPHFAYRLTITVGTGTVTLQTIETTQMKE